MMSPTTRVLSLLLLALLQGVRAPLKLTSNFANDREYPTDNRGDEDNISPPLSWSGAPKSTKSYVLLVESAAVDSSDDAERKTHWLVYDIPGEVNEMREELSGAGSSDVRRLGMKDDAGTPPVVVDPMGAIDGYVDPEIEAMQKTIYSALDESFEDRNRAKEGTQRYAPSTLRNARGSLSLRACAICSLRRSDIVWRHVLHRSFGIRNRVHVQAIRPERASGDTAWSDARGGEEGDER